MVRFIVSTWTLVAGWLWWVFVPKSAAAAIAGGSLLVALTAWLAIVMVRRSQRLRSSYEHVNARLEYHAGMSKDRWRRAKPARDDDGGMELTLGSGW